MFRRYVALATTTPVAKVCYRYRYGGRASACIVITIILQVILRPTTAEQVILLPHAKAVWSLVQPNDCSTAAPRSTSAVITRTAAKPGGGLRHWRAHAVPRTPTMCGIPAFRAGRLIVQRCAGAVGSCGSVRGEMGHRSHAWGRQRAASACVRVRAVGLRGRACPRQPRGRKRGSAKRRAARCCPYELPSGDFVIGS